jgi:hypothetical protein
MIEIEGPNSYLRSEEARIHAQEKTKSSRPVHRGKVQVNNRLRRLCIKYAISETEFYDLLINQDYACAICGKGKWRGAPAKVDHNHTTGKVRGLLCNRCNLALGLIRDSPETGRAMVKYLEGDAA